jgi:phospho-N-acetylmuramoyl-pentapeptide-transferase
MKFYIPFLKKKAYFQPIHDDVKMHEAKKITPTMGGIGIAAGVIFAAIAFICLVLYKTPYFIVEKNAVLQIILCLFIFVLYALVGLLDDVSKIKNKHNAGLSAKRKLVMQFLIAIIFLVFYITILEGTTTIRIPFSGIEFNIGPVYYVYVIFIFIAVTNSVNLTDGMDGLLSSVGIIFCMFFVFISIYSMRFLNMGFVFVIVIGALAGFLCFNYHPAKIFMGDTGSLSFGGIITAAALIMKAELYIPVVGIIFVIEALSDIIQVAYFKKTGGKRVFKMAPLHHHFELSGMKEKKVVNLFAWITLAAFAIAIGVLLLGNEFWIKG